MIMKSGLELIARRIGRDHYLSGIIFIGRVVVTFSCSDLILIAEEHLH